MDLSTTYRVTISLTIILHVTQLLKHNRIGYRFAKNCIGRIAGSGENRQEKNGGAEVEGWWERESIKVAWVCGGNRSRVVGKESRCPESGRQKEVRTIDLDCEGRTV